jgi:hypothetical protein
MPGKPIIVQKSFIFEIHKSYIAFSANNFRRRGSSMVSQRTTRKRKFNKLLLESIDETLSSLGENSKTTIYTHLETTFHLRKQEIPNRINDFSKALEKLFGLGSKHFEIMFMKNLYAKVKGFECFSCEMTTPKITLKDYVRVMRKNLEQANQSEEEIGILTNEHEEIAAVQLRRIHKSVEFNQ